MFHRVIGLSSVLLGCLAGCSLSGHGDRGCCQHGDSASCNAPCSVGEDCTCSAPLYPGDQNCQNNCQKHSRQRPMQRLATAFRRASSKRKSGPHASECTCESCGYESVMSQPMIWEQNPCGQPMCGAPQACGCDSCGPSWTGGWSAGDSPAGGGFYATPEQGSTGCDCGQQHSTNGSMYIPEGNAQFENSAEAPRMSVPASEQSHVVPRSFPPSPGSLDDNVAKPLPLPPSSEGTAPTPQDLTPMEPPMEFPKNTPGDFDPLQQEGAPAAKKVVDPVSFEIPRLPAIPERDHSSAKRGGPQPVRPIATDSERFQR